MGKGASAMEPPCATIRSSTLSNGSPSMRIITVSRSTRPLPSRKENSASGRLRRRRRQQPHILRSFPGNRQRRPTEHGAKELRQVHQTEAGNLEKTQGSASHPSAQNTLSGPRREGSIVRSPAREEAYARPAAPRRFPKGAYRHVEPRPLCRPAPRRDPCSRRQLAGESGVSTTISPAGRTSARPSGTRATPYPRRARAPPSVRTTQLPPSPTPCC